MVVFCEDVTDMRRYLGLERATLLIALDNGGINCGRTRKQQKKDLYNFINNSWIQNIQEIDDFILSLDDDQLEVICCGDYNDMKTVMLSVSAPDNTDIFLNDYFEEFC